MKRLGVVSRQAPTVMLTFPGTPCEADVIFIDPFQHRDQIEQQLTACDAVIVVRDLFQPSYAICIKICRERGIPHSFFTDDNYMVLCNELKDLAAYTVDAVREELRSFDAVMLSSDALFHFFEENALHPRLLWFGPVIDPACPHGMTPSEPGSKHLKIGFFGGGFRFQSFRRNALSHIRNISRAWERIDLYVREGFEVPDALPPTLHIYVLPVVNDFMTFIKSWRDLGLDIILHTHGKTANIDYKTANAALVSYYLGAVPILPDERIYQDAGRCNGIIVAPDDYTAWDRAIKRRLGVMVRRPAYSDLEAYCRDAFSPARNVETLKAILA